MIAGLLFATAEATDRHDTLAATLPVGGVTLVEFQARLLIAAGATQIVIVVSRLTPELLGAVNRIGKRGVAVDTVRTPSEAIAKLHPLARVAWLADGLVTTGAVIETMAGRDRDTLLTAPSGEGLERINPDAVWAGVATIDPQRIAEVARLPAEYDFASSLLRVTAQRGAELLPLPDAAVRDGHGVQRNSGALAARGRAALVAALGARSNWVDRFVIAPLVRIVLPPLVARGVPAVGLATVAILTAIGGLGALAFDWPVTGMIAIVVALMLFALSDVLAWLRDERALGRAIRWAIPGTAALAVLLYGREAGLDTGGATPLVLAIATVISAALAERAASATVRMMWWAVPIAYPLPLVVAAIAGQGAVGLTTTALYATATLAAAIDQLRGRVATTPFG